MAALTPTRRRRWRHINKLSPEAFEAELGRRLRALDQADRDELNEMKIGPSGRRILSRRPCTH